MRKKVKKVHVELLAPNPQLLLTSVGCWPLSDLIGKGLFIRLGTVNLAKVKIYSQLVCLISEHPVQFSVGMIWTKRNLPNQSLNSLKLVDGESSGLDVA